MDDGCLTSLIQLLPQNSTPKIVKLVNVLCIVYYNKKSKNDKITQLIWAVSTIY